MGSKIYDCWEKLVVAVVRNEQLHELAMCHSMDSSTLSERSSFSSSNRFPEELLEETNFSASPRDPGVFITAGATNLTIFCRDGSKKYQEFTCPWNFKAVELETTSSFVVRGRLKTFMLSGRSIYRAYLVFDGFMARWSAKCTIRFISKESDSDAEERAEVVDFKIMDDVRDEMKASREDGWLEVEIGDFYIYQGSYIEDVEVILDFNKGIGSKDDTIIAGIEFRRLAYVTEV